MTPELRRSTEQLAQLHGVIEKLEKERDEAQAKCRVLEVENSRLVNEITKLANRDLPDGVHGQPHTTLFPQGYVCPRLINPKGIYD